MNLRRWVLIIISCGLLSIFAPGQPGLGVACEGCRGVASGLLSIFVPGQKQGIPVGATFASNLPAFSAQDLPCAEVRQRYVGDALKVVYTSPSIYRRGAVLPKMEGLACLDVLADWLISRPRNKWKLSVGSETGTGFDSQALGDKRQELLQRYFLRKGIDTSGWKWQSGSRHHQLRLDELKDSP